jgi:glycosyltransferase involved in cell wall biosynthesis
MPVAISVVIPLYNKSAYVAEAVRSACEQACPPLEVIVVNDGTTDGSDEIVRALPYANLRLITIPNSGVSVARNTAIDAAQGDYVAFLDADDWWSPHFLCAIQHMIAQQPGASIYGTGSIEVLDGNFLPDCPAAKILTTPIEIIDNFFRERAKRSLFNNSTLCVPRALLQDKGIRFPAGEAHGEDHDFWFQLVECGPVAYLHLPLGAYRRGVANSLTNVFVWEHLEPAYQRLWLRAIQPAFPAHLRSAAKHLVHRRQTAFARNRLVKAGDVWGALRILFLHNHRPGTSLFWWSTLVACMLPGAIRKRVLAPGRGWKDLPLFALLMGKTPTP